VPVVASGTVAVLMDGVVAVVLLLLPPPHPVKKAVMKARTRNAIGDWYLRSASIFLQEFTTNEICLEPVLREAGGSKER
jgi:hypothetical protein